MLLERDGLSIRFDIKKRGGEVNNIDFGVTSDIVSFYSNARLVSDKELYNLENFLKSFLEDNLKTNEQFILDLDEMEDDNISILTFTNNNTMNGVDVGERLMELKVCYPTNYKTMNGDFFGFALYPNEIEKFVEEIEKWKIDKYPEEDILIMVKQKDGKKPSHLCIPLSKLPEWKEQQKKNESSITHCIFPKEEMVPLDKIEEELKKIKREKYEDIKNHEWYNDKYDEMIYFFIENKNASHAKAQRILACSYVRADMALCALEKYGYIAPSNMYYRTLITKEEFDEIIAKRH